MTEAEVRAFVIKKTQESLGRFIKRPPLTEKLLRKPPFRFLHDIVTAVIRQHGLMEGLFSAEEMISDNVKDKERKIAFLQKVIDTMRLVTGAQLNVRPSKIVAGQEAERTNELLQAIGKALERKLSSGKAVEQVLAASAGTSDPPVDSQPTEPAAPTTKIDKSSKPSKSKTKEKQKEEAQVNGKPRRSKQGSESRSKETGKQSSESKSSKHDGEGKSRRDRKSREEKPVEPEILGVVAIVNPSAPELTPDSSLPPQSLPDSTGVLENTHQPEEAQSLEPALTALSTEPPQLGAEESSTVLGGTVEPPQTSEERAPSATPSRVPTAIVTAPRPPSVRPGSARPRPLTARPAAPRLKERLVRPAREEHNSPISAEPPSNLITDTTNAAKEDDDDATFVVEETAAPQETVNNGATATALDPAALVPEHAGHLVSQILGAQRELEPQRDTQEETSGWHSGETWRHSEVTRLREAVQGLVRAANPLGRLLDFLQEDVEAMQLELETWQTENQELRAHIAREARATAESLAPLERELVALEVQAEQQRVALTSLKTVVLANEKRLTEMLLKL